jgi:hypothetical protein
MRMMREKGGPAAMGKGFGGPQEMFRAMMGNGQEDDRLAKYSTPELHALFNDWLAQLEEEIGTLSESIETVTPEIVAEAFKISVESAACILDRLGKKESAGGKNASRRKEGSNGMDE